MMAAEHITDHATDHYLEFLATGSCYLMPIFIFRR